MNKIFLYWISCQSLHHSLCLLGVGLNIFVGLKTFKVTMYHLSLWNKPKELINTDSNAKLQYLVSDCLQSYFFAPMESFSLLFNWVIFFSPSITWSLTERLKKVIGFIFLPLFWTFNNHEEIKRYKKESCKKLDYNTFAKQI